MPQKFYTDLINVLLTFFIFLLLIFFIVITLGIRYRRKKKENEDLRVQYSEQLLKSQIEIQEQTLQHVSTELHDNLGQVASLIKITLNTIKLDEPEAAFDKLHNSKALLKQLIVDIKLLSTSLNGDKMNKIGLMKALQNEAQKINKTGALTASFVQHDNIPHINDEKAIILYRMVQEIINNALKHAHAKHISINVYFQKNTFILKITDDGKGFNVQEKLADINDLGNGLINLQKRAKVIKGDISILSQPGSGTETTITAAM